MWWIVKRAWKHIPWKLVFAASVWLVRKGQERVRENLTKKEQEELLRLVRKSKGRSSALSKRDKSRVKNIAGKALRG